MSLTTERKFQWSIKGTEVRGHVTSHGERRICTDRIADLEEHTTVVIEPVQDELFCP